MTVDSLAFLDAHDQAELVRKREVTPRELVDAAIARIERLNPTLNAVVTPMFDEARAAVDSLPDGPLMGVPTLLKDLGAAYSGVRQASGSGALRDFVPNYDSAIITRLKAAGLVAVGKSATPEFGILPTTEPLAFGPTRNPWDLSRSSGGSSGGAAAAVAAGIVPVAHASDGGGSIRIPAANCGLVGLKPSRGRVSMAPTADTVGLSVWHAITRSVRDSALLLDIVSGYVPGDPYVAPPPARPFRNEVGAPTGRLRIALSTTPPNGGAVHPDCVAAVTDAALLCESLGHEVVEDAPPVDTEQLTPAFLTVWASMVAAGVDGLPVLTGMTPDPDSFEPLTRALAEQGRLVNASQYLQSLTVLQMIARRVLAWHERYDLLLTPVLAEPPALLGSFDSTPENPLHGIVRAGSYSSFTPLANVTGQPAISLPLHWNEGNLPIGVQFVARYGDEATLIRLAAQLEQARPWAGRIPPVHAEV